MNEFKAINILELSNIKWSKIFYKLNNGYSKCITSGSRNYFFRLNPKYIDLYNSIMKFQEFIDSFIFTIVEGSSNYPYHYSLNINDWRHRYIGVSKTMVRNNDE